MADQEQPQPGKPTDQDIQLRRSESRLRAIVETAVDGIITIDDRGVIETFNAAAERMFGYHADEVVGQNVSILMPSPDWDQAMQPYPHSGSPEVLGMGREVEGRRKDGACFPLHLTVGESRIDGHRIYAAILRDLTADKERQAQLQETRDALMLHRLFTERLSALAEMSGGIAHELNQPLSSIRVYAETVKALVEKAGDPEADEKVGHILEKIVQQVDRAALTIQHMREFAAEPAAGLPDARPVRVHLALQNLLDLVGAQLQSHGIQIENDIDPDLHVCCHLRRLEQVLLNLVTNARDGILDAGREPGRRQIRVWSEETADRVIIRIADTGQGIDPEVIDTVFHPFVTTKGPQRGTGLGLSICHGILRSYDAEITVESSSQAGTIIKLVFPACAQPQETSSK